MAAAMTTTTTLKTVVFLGSARNLAPPWGGDARLGDRVVEWVKSTLSTRASSLGDDVVKHEINVIDPIDVLGRRDAPSDLLRVGLEFVELDEGIEGRHQTRRLLPHR